jgi:hypothetical protein
MDKQKAQQMFELANRLINLDASTLSEQQLQQRNNMIFKLKEEIKMLDEASLAQMRDYFKATDPKVRSISPTAKYVANTDPNAQANMQKRFRSQAEYEEWLEKNGLKQISGVKKEGMAEEFNGEYDDEAGMVQSNLRTMARAVNGLLDTIEDNDNLPEWAQEKLAKAEMMTTSVWDYLLSQKEQGVDPKVENTIKEFAPDAGDGGEEETLHKYARMWYNGDLGTQQQVEKILARMGWEIGELESEEGGAFVIQAGDEHGDSYIGFTAVDLTEGVTEGSQRVDSLVTDTLRIMKGPEVSDAIQALKTVLGDREFSSRRGHYNFYVRQILDMYNQKGVTETKKPSPKLTPVNIKKTDPVSEEINTEAYERLQKVFAFKNYES